MEAKFPVPLTSQANDDGHDDHCKKQMAPEQTSSKASLGVYWDQPKKERRNRKSPQFLLSPNKLDDYTHKISLPNITNVNTCTIFFHDKQSALLGLFVKTVKALSRSTRTPAQKLVLVFNTDIGNYMEFYDNSVQGLTKRSSVTHTDSTAMVGHEPINVVP